MREMRRDDDSLSSTSHHFHGDIEWEGDLERRNDVLFRRCFCTLQGFTLSGLVPQAIHETILSLPEARSEEDVLVNIKAISKDVVVSSNMPENLECSGVFNGREGLIHFVEEMKRCFSIHSFSTSSATSSSLSASSGSAEEAMDAECTIRSVVHLVHKEQGRQTEARIELSVKYRLDFLHRVSLIFFTFQDISPSTSPLGSSPSLSCQEFFSRVSSRVRHGPSRLSSEPRVPSYRSIRALHISIHDFKLHKAVGQGGYGKVILATRAHDTNKYALKCISKAQLNCEGEREATVRELRLGRCLRHPFVSRILWNFKSENHLFLVSKFYPGGTLYDLMKSKAGRLNYDLAKFYAAQLVDVLDYLHAQEIAYRDLKPENLMIDEDGYLTLIDLGLCATATSSLSGASTITGTPEYMAPEMLEHASSYGYQVDWWALGVLMYEMNVGHNPFSKKAQGSLPVIFQNIREMEITLPDVSTTFKEDLAEILKLLLVRDPSKRVGKVEGEIRALAYFQGMDWDLLHVRQFLPPWKPPMDPKLDDCLKDALELCSFFSSPSPLEQFLDSERHGNTVERRPTAFLKSSISSLFRPHSPTSTKRLSRFEEDYFSDFDTSPSRGDEKKGQLTDRKANSDKSHKNDSANIPKKEAEAEKSKMETFSTLAPLSLGDVIDAEVEEEQDVDLDDDDHSGEEEEGRSDLLPGKEPVTDKETREGRDAGYVKESATLSPSRTLPLNSLLSSSAYSGLSINGPTRRGSAPEGFRVPQYVTLRTVRSFEKLRSVGSWMVGNREKKKKDSEEGQDEEEREPVSPTTRSTRGN